MYGWKPGICSSSIGRQIRVCRDEIQFDLPDMKNPCAKQALFWHRDFEFTTLCIHNLHSFYFRFYSLLHKTAITFVMIIPAIAPIAFFPESIHEKCLPAIRGFDASSNQHSGRIKNSHHSGFSHSTRLTPQPTVIKKKSR